MFIQPIFQNSYKIFFLLYVRIIFKKFCGEKILEIIRAENLKHVYKTSTDEKVALDGLNFTIDEGEFVAIIGINGSGKSTLAKHFNALLLPSDGKIFVTGLDTTDEKNLWRIRENVGMVFQNPDNEIVAAVVEDDVAFGCENLGVPPDEIKRRIDFALDAVKF